MNYDYFGNYMVWSETDLNIFGDKKSLEELLDEGKTLMEANKELKKQQNNYLFV